MTQRLCHSHLHICVDMQHDFSRNGTPQLAAAIMDFTHKLEQWNTPTVNVAFSNGSVHPVSVSRLGKLSSETRRWMIDRYLIDLQPSSLVAIKHEYSAYPVTIDFVRKQRITGIIVTGMAEASCVESTAVAFRNAGYEVAIPIELTDVGIMRAETDLTRSRRVRRFRNKGINMDHAAALMAQAATGPI